MQGGGVRERGQGAAHCGKRIEALNGLPTYLYGVKAQLVDQEGLGRTLADADRPSLLAIVKETATRLEREGSRRSLERRRHRSSRSRASSRVCPALGPVVRACAGIVERRGYPAVETR